MSDIDDFIREKNLQPKQKRSKLDAFHDEIFQLKEMGFSEKVIVEFLLEKKNVKVAQQTLNQFIRSRSRSGSLKSANAVEVATPQPQTEQPQAVPSQADNAPVRRGLRKPTPTQKFNWDERADPETLKAPPPAPEIPPENAEIDRHPINTGFKKFNSREQRDIDDLI